MARPGRKRLNLTPQDRVLGVRPRDQRDFFSGCNEPGKEWFQRDAHEFERIYCQFCKNSDCVRAKGAVSPWRTRMAEQADYLLNEPVFSDMSTAEHRRVNELAFEDIGRKMLRLEVARARQDWEVPDRPDYDKIAPTEVTDQFDEAVRSLAEAKGKKPPEMGSPVSSDGPSHYQATDPEPELEADPDPGLEYETQYPSSDGNRMYLVALTKGGDWSCECEGFRHVKRCKHLDTVRAWYEDQLRQAEDREEAERQAAEERVAPATPVPDPRVPVEQPFNTPMPRGGVMVGGGAAPERSPSRVPATPVAPHDPWALPQDNVVTPGATVTLKGKKPT